MSRRIHKSKTVVFKKSIICIYDNNRLISNMYEVICFDLYTRVRVHNFAFFVVNNTIHSGLKGVALKQSFDCFQSGW